MEGTDIPTLNRSDLPELHRIASDASRSGQNETALLTCAQLACAVGSAVVGSAGAGRSWQHAADLAAAVLFTGSLLVTVLLGFGRGQRSWYEGRAAAESVKSLSWKYVARAVPFDDERPAGSRQGQPTGQSPDSSVDALFVARLREIFAALGGVGAAVASAGPASGGYISDRMREIRGAPLGVRREVYLSGRIGGQIDWYRRKAVAARRAGRFWTAFAVLSAALGIAAAFWRAAGGDIDLLGPAAALIASASAWTQLRQYQPTSAAYSVTVIELELVRTEAPDAADEAAWAEFVDHAESAMSREHTLWLARRS